MICLIATVFISGFLIGICLGEKTKVSDVTISEILEIIGEVYDNSYTMRFADYEELCRRVKALRMEDKG